MYGIGFLGGSVESDAQLVLLRQMPNGQAVVGRFGFFRPMSPAIVPGLPKNGHMVWMAYVAFNRKAGERGVFRQ